MTSSRTGYLAMTVVLVLSLGFAGYALQLSRRSEADLQALMRRAVRLDATVKDALQKADADRKDLAALVAVQKKAQAASAPARGPAGGLGPLKPGERGKLLAANPKLRELYLASSRANLQVRYEGLYQKLGLTPEQIDKFETLAIGYEDKRLAATAAATAQGIDSSDPAQVAARKQDIDQYHTALSSAVSPDFDQQVLALNRVQNMQDMARGVAGMAAAGSEPFTGQQSLELAQILANSSSSYVNGGDANVSTLDWDAAYTAAAKSFTPDQLQGLKAQQNIQALSKLVKQYYSDSGPAK